MKFYPINLDKTKTWFFKIMFSPFKQLRYFCVNFHSEKCENIAKMEFSPFFAIFGKKCQKPRKRAKKGRFCPLFWKIPVWACEKGGVTVLAIFVVNLINVLFSPQNPKFLTLGSKTKHTFFLGDFRPFLTPKITILDDFWPFFIKNRLLLCFERFYPRKRLKMFSLFWTVNFIKIYKHGKKSLFCCWNSTRF